MSSSCGESHDERMHAATNGSDRVEAATAPDLEGMRVFRAGVSGAVDQ